MIVSSQMKTLSNEGEVPLTAATLPIWTATAIPCIIKLHGAWLPSLGPDPATQLLDEGYGLWPKYP